MFSNLSKTSIVIWATYELLYTNVFNLDQAKIFSFGKELMCS